MSNQPKQFENKKPELATQPYTPRPTKLAWAIRVALSKWKK